MKDRESAAPVSFRGRTCHGVLFVPPSFLPFSGFSVLFLEGTDCARNSFHLVKQQLQDGVCRRKNQTKEISRKQKKRKPKDKKRCAAAAVEVE